MSTTLTPTTDSSAAPASADGAKGGGKAKLLIAVVLVVALAGGGWFVFLRGGGEEKAPEPGEVVVLEPIQVNLAGGHYLRIGLALQLTASAHEADGSKALDAAISLFSGRKLEELTEPAARRKLKKELEHELAEGYHHEVMGVYFTEFVTQ